MFDVVAAGYRIRPLVDPLMPSAVGARQAEVADEELAHADDKAQNHFVVAWRVWDPAIGSWID